MSEVPVSPNQGSGQGSNPGDGPASPVDALIPAFAIGAADVDEVEAVKRELGRNCDAAEELVAFSMLAERLLYAPPAVTPPAALAERIRASLATSSPGAAVGPASRLASPIQLEAVPAPVKQSGRRWLWPVMAAAAALVLLAGLNLFLLREIASLRSAQAELSTRFAAQTALLEQQEDALTAQQSQLAEQDTLLAALVSSEGERYTMNAAQEGSQALAEVAWLFDKNVAVLRASGFPALEAGKVYQLWLISNGERMSGGTFVVDEQGTGTFVFTPPESLDNFEGMGITPEPAGGSPGPTAPPVVRAQL
jgi:hypothetical protein